MSDYSLAGGCVVPHLRCLRWCGFCRVSAHSSTVRAAHDLYCFLVLAICSLYLAQECIYACQEYADMEKLSRVMFLLLCHVTSLAKQFVFYKDAAKIDNLVTKLDDPLFNMESGQRLLARTARRARTLQRCYSGCAVVTCALWLVFPVARLLRAQTVEFSFWLPIQPQSTSQISLVLLYSHYITTLVGIANTTMDAFIGTILYQCTSQLNILRFNIENILPRTQREVQLSGGDFEHVLLNKFYKCLHHYNNITEVTNSLQSIFGTAIMIQFAIGGWILCMAAYKLVSLTVLSVEFASMALFILCILTELFLYCFFGNELTYESAQVSSSLYASGWEAGRAGWGCGRGRRFARALLLAGERARRPLRATAARLVPLSLETFLKILKSSYTFYTVLRQTKRSEL